MINPDLQLANHITLRCAAWVVEVCDDQIGLLSCIEADPQVPTLSNYANSVRRQAGTVVYELKARTGQAIDRRSAQGCRCVDLDEGGSPLVREYFDFVGLFHGEGMCELVNFWRRTQ